jgi:hypothetical protein
MAKKKVEDDGILKMYAVRNKEGKWFRRKGYGGYGSTWTDDLKLARIYGKTGGPRGVISWFANTYPEYGVPDLVIFKMSDMEVVDESERVQKQARRKELAAIKSKQRLEQRKIDELERRKRKTDKELADLKKKIKNDTKTPEGPKELAKKMAKPLKGWKLNNV